MFFEDGSDLSNLEGAAKNIELADISLKSMKKTLANVINPFSTLNDIAAINQKTASSIRTTMGQTADAIENMQISFAKANFLGAEFGITEQENLKLFESLNSEIRRNTYLTSEQIFKLNLLAKNAGLTGEQMGKFVSAFDSLGMGTDEAIESVNVLEKRARTYGINVSQYMGVITENVKKLSGYKFKDGIAGMSEMVAQAQSLKMSVEPTYDLANKLLDPMQAVEFANSMQLLGGAAASELGDFQELMYLAQNDVGELQNRVANLLKSEAMFNEETGAFEISGAKRRELKQLEGLLGQSFDQLAESSMLAASREKKLELLGDLGNSLTEEQKEYLANVAQISKGTGGEFGLKVKVGDELLDVEGLDPNVLDSLLETQKEEGVTMEDIGRQQLGYLEDIANKINQLTKIPETQLIAEGTAGQYFDTITENYANQIDELTKFTNNYTEEKLPGFIESTIATINTGINVGVETVLSQLNELGIDDLNVAIELLTESVGGATELLGDFGDEIRDFIDPTYERERRSTYERDLRPTYERENDISELLNNINDTGGLLRPTDSENDNINPMENLAVNTEVQLSPDQNSEVLYNMSGTQSDMEQFQNRMASLYENNLNLQNQTIPVALTVNGNVSLDLNNMKYANLDVDKLGRELMNNSQVIAQISDKLTNADGGYGLGLRVG